MATKTEIVIKFTYTDFAINIEKNTLTAKCNVCHKLFTDTKGTTLRFVG